MEQPGVGEGSGTSGQRGTWRKERILTAGITSWGMRLGLLQPPFCWGSCLAPASQVSLRSSFIFPSPFISSPVQALALKNSVSLHVLDASALSSRPPEAPAKLKVSPWPRQSKHQSKELMLRLGFWHLPGCPKAMPALLGDESWWDQPDGGWAVDLQDLSFS